MKLITSKQFDKYAFNWNNLQKFALLCYNSIKREFGISYMLNVGVSVYRYLNPIVKVWIILSDMFGT